MFWFFVCAASYVVGGIWYAYEVSRALEGACKIGSVVAEALEAEEPEELSEFKVRWWQLVPTAIVWPVALISELATALREG